MEASEYVDMVTERLAASDREVTRELIGGHHCVVAYLGQFRASFGFSKLHLFTAVGAVKHAVEADALEVFSNDVIEHSIADKGALRGFQVTIGTIPVLIGPAVTPETITLTSTKIVETFSAFAWPTAVDLTTSTLYSHQGPADKFSRYADFVSQQIASTLHF
jgi:hypothetical protein